MTSSEKMRSHIAQRDRDTSLSMTSLALILYSVTNALASDVDRTETTDPKSSAETAKTFSSAPLYAAL